MSSGACSRQLYGLHRKEHRPLNQHGCRKRLADTPPTGRLRTSVVHRHHRGRAQVVLACGPVPPRRWAACPAPWRWGQAARTAGLPDVDDARVGRPDVGGTTSGRPDGDGKRVGRPVRRHRPIAVGSPSACRRDRPAGRHHGVTWPEYFAMGGAGIPDQVAPPASARRRRRTDIGQHAPVAARIPCGADTPSMPDQDIGEPSPLLGGK